MYPKIKRLLDIVGAAVLLLLFLPFMLLLCALLFSTQPRRVFFSQPRVGKNDKIFTIRKFCTLSPSSEANLPLPAPFATPIGAALRAWSLDELPQLWNILVGDMSFVGPRPVVPDETALLARRRALGVTGVRPGLTGLAQVRGRKQLTVEDKACCDAYYCKEMSFSFDLYILWRTLFCLHCPEESARKNPLTNR